MVKQPVTSFDIEGLASRLVSERKKSNLSRDDVVELSTTGFARSSLQEWEGAKREPKLEYIYDLARIYGVSPWKLLSGHNEPTAQQPQPANDDEFAYISAYDIEASAGHGSFINGEETKKHLAFRKRWLTSRGLHAKDLAVLFTKGDSMEPTIPDGAAIVINRAVENILDGRIYVICINGELYVKRVQRIPSGIRLISDNKFYDALDINPTDFADEQYKVCGQVIHASYDLPD